MTPPPPASSSSALGNRELADVALKTAHEAARLVMQGYRAPKAVSEKGRADLVSEYDEKSEALIRRLLAERAPGIPIVGEEQGGAQGDGRTWFIDPIDGTVNYVHGHPYFSVSIGMLEQGEPVCGAVVAPALELDWVAWRGEGSDTALRDGKPCRVSHTTRLADALVSTGFPTDPDQVADNNLDSFVHVIGKVRDIRRCASAAIDICMVADGTYDACWERKLRAWDTAAAACVALSAGATITNLSGGPYDLSVGYVIVSNGLVHDDLRDALKDRR